MLCERHTRRVGLGRILTSVAAAIYTTSPVCLDLDLLATVYDLTDGHVLMFWSEL